MSEKMSSQSDSKLENNPAVEDINQPKLEAALSPEELDRVKADVLQLAHLMLEKLRVSPDEVEWPEIILDDQTEGTSYYGPKNNTIGIHSDHIHSVNTYGEEIAHWIRFQLTKQDIVPSIKDTRLEEFLGRLGEGIAREVVGGTELEPLLKEDARNKIEGSPRDLLLYVERRVFSFESQIKELAREVRKYQELTKLLNSAIKKAAEGYEQLLDGSLSEENLSFIQDKSIDIFKEFLNDLKGALKDKEWVLIEEKIVFNLEGVSLHLKELLSLVTENEKVDDKLVSKIKLLLIKIAEHFYKMDFYLSGNPLELDIALRANILSIIRQLDHSEGYIAAEYYMENVPNWLETTPELFRDSYNTLTKHVKTEQVETWLKRNGVYEIYNILDNLNKLIDDAESGEEKVGVWNKGQIAINGVLGRFSNLLN